MEETLEFLANNSAEIQAAALPGAQDYYRLEETLEFLANNSAEIQAAALPGAQQAGRYTLTDASQAAVQSYFNLSPACAQSASDKEP